MNGCSGDTLEEEHRESNIFEDYLSFTREMQHGRFTGRLRPWDCVLVLSYMYVLFRDRDRRQEIHSIVSDKADETARHYQLSNLFYFYFFR